MPPYMEHPAEGPIPDMVWGKVIEPEFTDRFPKFYLDILQRGTDNDKQTVAVKLFNACHQNNYLATKFKEYPGACDILHAYRVEATERGLNRDSNDGLVGSLLHSLGYDGYQTGFTVPYCAPDTDEETKNFTFFNLKGNGYMADPPELEKYIRGEPY